MKRIEIEVPYFWDGLTALSVVHLLDSVTSAIWQAHGEAMARELQPSWQDSGLVNDPEADQTRYEPEYDNEIDDEIPF